MATKEIKNRIVLEGEKEYNAALKEANRNLKTLKSELTAETAELGRNATEQQKVETRVKNLKKQIAEQEKVVKTYEKALEEVRQKYGDNEDAIASWEQKLNNARATLGNMRNDLENVGDGFRIVETDAGTAVVATKSIAEAMGEIASAGSAVSDKIEDIFTGMIDAVTDALSGLWGMIAETAARANAWTDLAQIWNTDPAKIEKYARGVEWAGKSFSDLQNAVSKIAMGDADKIFDLTGVSHIGDVDEWQYAMDVLSSISGMDYQSKLNALGEIFGDKRAANVMDIVNAWGTITEGADKLTEGGYGLGDEQLAVMNEIQEKINGFEASWKALKEHVAAGLGEAVLPLMIDVQNGLDGIAAFLGADNEAEREAALQQIRESIESFFRKVADIIKEAISILSDVGNELSGSDDPVVSAVGNIMSGLAESLQWMIDNQDAVKGAFITIFGFWVMTKLAAVHGKLREIRMEMAAIKLFKGLSLGGTAASAAAGAGTGATAGATAGWLGASVRAAIPNAIAAFGIHEIAKAMPANLLLAQTDAQKTLDEVNQAHGINTIGDVERQLAGTDQERNRSTMGFFWDTLLHPGKDLDDAADKLQEAAEALEEEEDEELDGSGLLLSPADRQVYEDVWDQRGFGEAGEAYQRMQEMFAGSEGLFDELIARLEGLYESGYQEPDLPEWWFQSWPGTEGGNSGDGITSGDLQSFRGLPAQIQAAARAGTAAGISGIRVYMDGVAVGHLVAPTVSQDIAATV